MSSRKYLSLLSRLLSKCKCHRKHSYSPPPSRRTALLPTFDFPEDLLIEIFAFVGPGQFRYVALVNKDYYCAYCKTFCGSGKRFTTQAAAVGSISRIRIWMAEALRAEQLPQDIQPHIAGSAAALRQLDLLKWMLRYDTFFSLRTSFAVCHEAARNGHLHVLQWARMNGCPWDKETCAYAAANGHLEVLKWARKCGCCWDESTCCNAARNGHFEVLEWANLNGCQCDTRALRAAARHGHLHILKWAVLLDFYLPECICYEAALNGHLDIIQFATAHGFPCDEVTCAHAAMRGHLNILRWAKENNCPCDERTCIMFARRYDRTEVIEWFRGNGALMEDSILEGVHAL